MQATDQALDPVLNTDNCESDAAPPNHALFIISTRRGDGFNASIHGHMLELEILSDPALAKVSGRVPHRLERGQDVDRKAGA